MSINPVWFLFASIQFNVSRFAFITMCIVLSLVILL